MGLLGGAVELVGGAVGGPEVAVALKVWNAIKRGWQWLEAHPEVLLSLLLAFASWLAYHEHGRYVKMRDGRQADHAAYRAAQDAATARAIALKAAYESAGINLAKGSQDAYQDGLQDGDDRLAAYVQRMQPGAQGQAGQSAAAAADHNPAVPRPATAAATVAFTEEQLKGWETDYEYAVQCRLWALGIAKLFDGSSHPELGNPVASILPAKSSNPVPAKAP